MNELAPVRKACWLAISGSLNWIVNERPGERRKKKAMR
jgi:hypothetical protein